MRYVWDDARHGVQEVTEERSTKPKLYWAAMFVVLAVIAWTIRVPGCRERPRGHLNEASAISALRTIWSAEELYKDRTGKYGNCLDLNDGKKTKFIDIALTKADPDHPEHTDKAGYNIDISVSADNTDWCAIAYPARWGFHGDGQRNFKITSDGTLYYNTTKSDLTNFTEVLGGD
jgi:hypothetical protein